MCTSSPRRYRDFDSKKSIRAVDEQGQIKQLSDKSGEQMVNDNYLRSGISHPQEKRVRPAPAILPTDHFNNRLGGLSGADGANLKLSIRSPGRGQLATMAGR